MPSKIPTYPKRLIEVDLPIKKISEHSRREKSIRHGHISTLHIWWARRPLAACRAVICASLWLDPADPLCPKDFVSAAQTIMDRFWNQQQVEKRDLQNLLNLRQALLDFIADFANWDNSTKDEYLNPARELTQAAHEALGGKPGTRPLVVDPFAGGGSIPLEALRVGADAYASDLNPVAVLLNKVVLEYIPKYGRELADEVRKWGQWIKEEAEKELAEFYPKDPDGSIPIAYLWAKTIRCEGPGCGIEVPLIKNLWLSKPKGRNSKIAIKLNPNYSEKKVDLDLLYNATDASVGAGTVKRGSATCPCCKYTTPLNSVRNQLRTNNGGVNNSRLFCVVMTKPGQRGRFYRVSTTTDLDVIKKSKEKLDRLEKKWEGKYSLTPLEPTPIGGGNGAGRAFSQRKYGMDYFKDFFTSRQLLALTTIVNKINDTLIINRENSSLDFVNGLILILSCALDREAEHLSALCRWNSSGEKMQASFGRQTFPITWDFCEANLFGESVGSWTTMIDLVTIPFETSICLPNIGHITKSSAYSLSFSNDSIDLFFTDPPYYDAIPYADLSDFFFVWLKRTISSIFPDLFNSEVVEKDDECILDEIKGKDKKYFENSMKLALSDGRRALKPKGIGVVVFANKTTTGWEVQLQAMIDAGWTITASWPIDTEMGTRLRAQNSAALASSIHLVCRPRENPDGSLREEIGDWREVLQELPVRIHEWMPRLATEGVVGADAIFACLGPALEIFSRYSSVEKPNGDVVTLQEYLEHVWAAVAKEALSMIFTEADTSEFEGDARITAMWLWTLAGGVAGSSSDDNDDADEEEESGSNKKLKGYVLEYDAARKIAQGLGADLSALTGLIEVKGDKARLLPVGERSKYLFGKSGTVVQTQGRKKKDKQLTLGGLSEEETDISHEVMEMGDITPGKTTLDQIHQSMILFQAGKGEALKSFLLEHGHDQKFWKLAQSLSALYPTGTEEKRWVDGVLARKKGLGL